MAWENQSQAQQLLDMGMITADQFNSVYPPAPPVAPVEDSVGLVEPVEAAAPIAPPPVSPEPIAPPPVAPPAADPLGMAAAYGNAFPPSPETTTTEGLGPRDAMNTEALAAAYGSPVVNAPPAPAAPPEPALPQAVIPPPTNQPQQPAAPQFDPMTGMISDAMSPFALREQALKDATATGQMKAAEETAALEKLQADQTRRLAEDAQWAETQQKGLDEKMAQLQKKSDEIATRKVDQRKYWSDKTTGEKILAGIALFLGAFGGGRTGENQAAKVIMQAIDRDIDLQKADIQGAKDNLQRQFTLYGDSLGRFKDERSAKNAARVHGLELAQLDLQRLASKYKGPEMAAKAKDLMGQLETQKQIYKGQIMQNLQTRLLMDAVAKGQRVNPALLPKEMGERLVSGYGFANDHEGAKYLRSRAPDVEASKSALKELIQMAKDSRLGKLSPEQRARSGQLRSILQGSLRVDLLGPGTVQQHEREMLDNIIADPNAILTLGTEVTKLGTLLERINSKWASELNVHGITSPDQRFNFTAAGGR